MDKFQFWQLIEESKNERGDCSKQVTALEDALVKLDAEEILQFDDLFNVKVMQANTPELWAISYIIAGARPEHPFDYFRFWLVSQGRDYFEMAVRAPDQVADAITDSDCFCEALGHTTKNAYQRKTGVPMYDVLEERQSQQLAGFLERHTSPLGTQWKDDEELKARFPRLCARFE